MKRALRLRELWSWLPAFRAAAETEHLPTASERLHITPSSISRAIRLLEDSLDTRLFDREGRSMRLNRNGRAMLSAVRDAMRILDEAVNEVTGASLRGAVDISAPSDYVPLVVLPALAQVAARHAQLSPRLSRVANDDIVSLLLRGQLDVAISDEPIKHGDLRLERLASLEQGVYGKSSRYVAFADDSWPPDQQRDVAAEVSTPSEAAALCAQAGFAAVLPRVIARAHGLSAIRGAPAISDRAIYLIFRRPLGEHPRTDAVLAALRSAASQL